MTNFPPPDYDHAVGAYFAPTTPPPPPPLLPRHAVVGQAFPRRDRRLALVLGPAVVGYAIGQNHDSSSTASSGITQPSANSPSNGSQSGERFAVVERLDRVRHHEQRRPRGHQGQGRRLHRQHQHQARQRRWRPAPAS